MSFSLLGVVLLATSTSGAQFELRQAPGLPPEVPIEVRSADGRAVLRRSIRPGTRELLALVPGAWTVRSPDPAVWIAPLHFVVQEAEPLRSHVLTALPSREIRLRIAWKGDPPSGATAYFGDPGQRWSDSSRCHLVGALVTCQVPASPLDLRIHLPGYAPIYRWHSLSRPFAPGVEPADLGTVELCPGASVSGWIMRVGGGASIEATVRAITSGSVPLLRQAGSLASPVEDRVKANGFFQLCGLGTGTIDIEARTSTGATGVVGGVALEAGEETRLRGVLELTAPSAVRIVASPPIPPSGGRWRVTLTSLNGAELRRGHLQADGVLLVDAIPRGRYLLTLLAGEDEQWFQEEIDVHEAHQDVSVGVSVTVAFGRLTIDGEPTQGTLVFGGERGAVRVRSEADADGSFTVLLPARPTRWVVGIRLPEPNKLSTTLPDVDVSRLPLEIEVPLTRLHGTVRSEEGVLGAAGCRVQVLHGGGLTAFANCGVEGAYELKGLHPGPVVVWAASSDGRSSGLISKDLRASGDLRVDLKLMGRKLVQGWVVTSDGDPVAGASVSLASGPLTLEETADSNGHVTFHLPAASNDLAVSVAATGFARTVQQVTLREDGTFVVPITVASGTLEVVVPHGSDPRELTLRSESGAQMFLTAVAEPRRAGTAEDVLTINALAVGKHSVCSGTSCIDAIVREGSTTRVAVAKR